MAEGVEWSAEAKKKMGKDRKSICRDQKMMIFSQLVHSHDKYSCNILYI